MTTKPTLTFWQIWNMCFGFLGIQFGFALQNANVSRFFQTLGAGVDPMEPRRMFRRGFLSPGKNQQAFLRQVKNPLRVRRPLDGSALSRSGETMSPECSMLPS